eukprot:1823627-Pyramimonas_sp.AAC.1
MHADCASLAACMAAVRPPWSCVAAPSTNQIAGARRTLANRGEGRRRADQSERGGKHPKGKGSSPEDS